MLVAAAAVVMITALASCRIFFLSVPPPPPPILLKSLDSTVLTECGLAKIVFDWVTSKVVSLKEIASAVAEAVVSVWFSLLYIKFSKWKETNVPLLFGFICFEINEMRFEGA